ELAYIGQRESMGIRYACRPGFGCEFRIQPVPQRLNPASCSPLAFEKDNLEAAFAQLICTTQASQSPTDDNYSSSRGVCGSKGRSHRPCEECPPVHSALPSFLALWTVVRALQ